MSKGIEIFLIINMRRKFKLLDSGTTKRMHTGGDLMVSLRHRPHEQG